MNVKKIFPYIIIVIMIFVFWGLGSQNTFSVQQIIDVNLRNDATKMVLYPANTEITDSARIKEVFSLLDTLILKEPFFNKNIDGGISIEIITKNDNITEIRLSSNVLTVNGKTYTLNKNICNDLRSIFGISK